MNLPFATRAWLDARDERFLETVLNSSLREEELRRMSNQRWLSNLAFWTVGGAIMIYLVGGLFLQVAEPSGQLHSSLPHDAAAVLALWFLTLKVMSDDYYCRLLKLVGRLQNQHVPESLHHE